MRRNDISGQVIYTPYQYLLPPPWSPTVALLCIKIERILTKQVSRRDILLSTICSLWTKYRKYLIMNFCKALEGAQWNVGNTEYARNRTNQKKRYVICQILFHRFYLFARILTQHVELGLKYSLSLGLRNPYSSYDVIFRNILSLKKLAPKYRKQKERRVFVKVLAEKR